MKGHEDDRSREGRLADRVWSSSKGPRVICSTRGVLPAWAPCPGPETATLAKDMCAKYPGPP
eukprot:5148184-Pyramimonas_sp.AAC.1